MEKKPRRKKLYEKAKITRKMNDHMIKIADAFEVSIDELVGGGKARNCI